MDGLGKDSGTDLARPKPPGNATLSGRTIDARSRTIQLALAVVAFIAVFLVHFRPWQGGLLEDWAVALVWRQNGSSGMVALLPQLLGRPLSILPSYIGLMMSDGGFVGHYAVLGAIAVAQLGASLWAIAPLTNVRLLRWAVALAIALHPWWTAGDILRFLPGQVSVLGVIVWFGASLRFLTSGRAKWALLLVLAPMFGLLTYQAPAAALVLGSAVLAVMTRATWRRRAALVGLTAGLSAAVMAWSVLLAPRLSPATYESQLIVSRIDILASLHTILRTIALHGQSTAFAALIVVVIVIALGFNGRLPAGHAWLLLVGVAAAPFAALTYASQTLHLNDPERVALPIGVMLWVVLCCALPALSTDRLVRVVTTGVLVAGTTVGAVLGYGTWTNYAGSQQVLIGAIQSVRKNVPDDAQLVVADQTGRFGDVYLLLPPHLNIALDVEYGAGADAVLCTPADVKRIQPIAALYPIATTPDCGALLDGKAVTPLADLVTTQGTFKIYQLEPGK